MYGYTLHRRGKLFCCYSLQAFRTAKTLKYHIKDCFQINGKKRIKMPKKDEYIRFKICEINIKLLFMIYEHFERILVPEDNGKQNSKESYTNKYQKIIVCSYGCEDAVVFHN